MTDLLDRLPGDIPGLPGPGDRAHVVCHGVYAGDTGVIVQVFAEAGQVLLVLDRAGHSGEVLFDTDEIEILLADSREARMHAVWWLLRQRKLAPPHLDQRARIAVVRGIDPLPLEMVDTLARAVLNVAGREA